MKRLHQEIKKMPFSIRSASFCAVAVMCLIMGLFMPPTLAKEGITAEDSLKQGRLLLDRGGFEKAIPKLEKAAGAFGKTGKLREQAEALRDAGTAYQALGRYKKALDRLKTALALAESLDDGKMTALILGPMGNVSFSGANGRGSGTTQRGHADSAGVA